MSDLQSIRETVSNNKTYILLFFVTMVILFMLIYISNKLNLKNKNCFDLSKQTNTTVGSIEKTTGVVEETEVEIQMDPRARRGFR